MITLYSLPHSPYSSRCRIAIYHKELPIQIQAPIGGLRSSEYHALIASKKVPALVTENHTIIESSAILEYLEDRFPEHPLRASSPEDRAEQRALISFMDFSIAPHIFPLFKAMMKPEQRDQLPTTVQELQEKLFVLEKLFTQSNRNTDTLDMADCGLLPSLFYAKFLMEKLGFDPLFAKTDTLDSWWQHRREIPAVARTLDEIETGLTRFLQAYGKRS